MLWRPSTAERIRHAVLVSHAFNVHRRALLSAGAGVGFDAAMVAGDLEYQYSPAAGFVARRSAVLFGALGVMFISCGRHRPRRRSAICSGFMVGCFGLAALGFGEWLNGHLRAGYLTGDLVELALGLGFIQTRRVSLELGETVG